MEGRMDIGSRFELGAGRRSSLLQLTLRIVLAAFIVSVGLSHALAQPFQDVTSEVKITTSGNVFSRVTNTFNATATITNTSGVVLNAPLVLTISAITPATVTLANAAGQGPSGNSYVNLPVPANGLSPGAAISNVLLEFNDSTKAAFTFAPSVANILAPFATSSSTSVVFHSPSGTTALTIPLVNQSVVTSTPQGDVTNVTQQRANISADGSHVGVYTLTFPIVPTDGATESLASGTFAYYDPTGQLWQTAAVPGDAFYLPPRGGQQYFSADGSRILLVDAQEANSNPTFFVYDNAQDLIYQDTASFLELYQAQISPNGQYVLAVGIVNNNGTNQDTVWALDLNTQLSSTLPIQVATGGLPTITVASDGRFLASYQGNQVELPSQ